MTRYFLVIFLLAAVVFVGCSSPQVAIRSNYNFHKVHRVAVLGFQDYPKADGSGDIVASTFEKTLLTAGYDVIERRQVQQILKEQAMSLSGTIDPKTALKIGNILGVDALVLGDITTFMAEKKSVMLVDVNDQIEKPIIEHQVTEENEGGQVVHHAHDVVVGYKTIYRKRQIPEEYDTNAEVGLSVRMVDAHDAELLWSASWSYSASNVERVAEVLSERIMNALKSTWPSSN